MAGASLAATLLLLELAVRLVPAFLPTGVYGSSRFDPALHMAVHAGPAIYNKVRFLRRTPNRDGFMDVEHAEKKPQGTLRVGFFGDSYVEALQVPLEEAFFRRIPRQIADHEVETFGIGISSWGTLHEMLAYETMGPRYDLDVIVYLFVENDLGDNSYLIEAHAGAVNPKPYAELSDDAPGYTIHWNRDPMEAESIGLRLGRFVQRHSQLAQVIWSRVKLLRTRGVAVTDDLHTRSMSEVAGAVPNENALPSSWPPAYAQEAKTLAFRILAAWNEEVHRAGKQFVVFYVPRSNEQLDGRIPIENTWYPWLAESCATLKIPLIDPSPELRAVLESGIPVYDDHWTPEGHAAVARVLTAYLERAVEIETLAQPGSATEAREAAHR